MFGHCSYKTWDVVFFFFLIMSLLLSLLVLLFYFEPQVNFALVEIYKVQTG